jgi:electron transfer flavoprotein beta subunit
MKILVCVKQTADLESKFKPNSAGTWYNETDLAFRMNEYDEYAVEQAVQVKEQQGGGPDVTVLSIGPDRAVEAVKKALAMGCDRGVHIKDEESWQKDPWQIASAIALFSREKNFDVIFFGMQSQDRGSAQVGPLVAELLGLPCATTVVNFTFNEGAIVAKRELEGGLKCGVKLSVPAVITCQLGLNKPRYPTLPNIMKAKKKELLTLPAADYVKSEAFTAVAAFSSPEKRGNCMILEGEVNDTADRLIAVLKEKTGVVR